MQTTTTTDQAADVIPADPAHSAAPPSGHRLRPTRRRRPDPKAVGGGVRPPGDLRTTSLGGRLRGVRATQAAFDGETRMRRLLTAVLLSALVLVLVLAAAQDWLGLIVALVATAVVVGAIMIFGPHDETAQPEGGALDQVVAAQRDELAALRRRADDAEASSTLLAELASRHRALLVRQLTQIDQLEAKEADPAALGELFALDHLATRMRRCSEGVLLLSGRDEHPTVGAPVAASEVLRGAVAEVEDFSRVEVSLDREVEVAGEAVIDVVHLLAELIENATVYSSPTTPVRVRGHVTGDAFAVTVTDQGVGMAPDRLTELNQALARGDVPSAPGQVGFPVVARLAARQGVYVGLAANADGGTEVTVVLPSSLVGSHGAPAAFPASVPPSPPVAPTPPPPVAPPAAPPVAAPTAPTTYVPRTDEPAAEVPPASYEPASYEPASYEQPAYEPASYEPASEQPAYEQPAYEQPAYEQTYQPFEAPGFAAPSFADPSGAEPSYGESTVPSYAQPEEPLTAPVADPDDGAEPDLAWALTPTPAPPQDDLSSWSEPSWAEAAQPSPFVPPVHVEDPAPAPLAPMPEPPSVPMSSFVPPEPPSVEPSAIDLSQTAAGLIRRVPLTNMAPQIAEPDHTLADDVASQPTPDRSRHLFAAYRDGLTLGRNGLADDAQPDEPQGEIRP